MVAELVESMSADVNGPFCVAESPQCISSTRDWIPFAINVFLLDAHAPPSFKLTCRHPIFFPKVPCSSA